MIKNKYIILYKYDEEYTVFMDDNYIYNVKGIKETIRNMVPENALPTFVNTVLLPFNNKIVYDSYINQYAVSFGKGLKDTCDKSYKTLKK